MRDLHLHAAPLGTELRGSPRRIQQFAAGRRCAGQALRDAGATDLAVGVAGDRAPVWPAGFVGSITHSVSFAWAAVARAADLESIGIDSEPFFDDDAMRDVAPRVLDVAERKLVNAPFERELATLAFSAKESLYKCLNPRLGVFFEFDDVELAWITADNDVKGAFGLRLRRSLAEGFPSGRLLEGKYALELDHIHACVELCR